MIDPIWLLQAFGALICALVFAWIVGYLMRGDDPISRLDAIVGMSGLTVIALGNVMTAFATAIGWMQLRDFGGTSVRGALLVLALYFAASVARANARRRRRRRSLDSPDDE